MSQHRSQQEWLRLVQKYYNSEQSAAQFCLEHNLHVPRDVTPQWLGLLLKELAAV
ncbi:hypothetical protein [Vibrio sp. 10N.261.46.A3]|uniref:hypothetical protein n=1 Tax=Vibrio sp. 10N.261.46.A3 TaxID=3229658 RepID=UPI00355410A8